MAEHPAARVGAERLAGILLELAGEQPAVKRRLRFKLAGEAGSEMIAWEMNKRITTLRSARSFVDWQKRANFVRDLDLTRRTIVTDRVGQSRPDLALDLMWRFMAVAEPVINRIDACASPDQIFGRHKHRIPANSSPGAVVAECGAGQRRWL